MIIESETDQSKGSHNGEPNKVVSLKVIKKNCRQISLNMDTSACIDHYLVIIKHYTQEKKKEISSLEIK